VTSLVRTRNAVTLELKQLPRLPIEAFQTLVRTSLQGGARVAAFFGLPEDRLSRGARLPGLRLLAVLADDREGTLSLCSANVRDAFPSLTPEFPQLHRFEREIYEQWGVEPSGHPWLKPVRFQRPFLIGDDVETLAIGEADFFRVGGAEIHEVAVGPVHAGIIEPGHFRFQCLGEHVYHLEIALGYQHRGVERPLVGGPDQRTLHYIETAAGDTTIGHALAYARAVEALGDTPAPPRALALRAVALELERLANHVGDLGALAGDVAFLPTASYCGRIRGDFLNLTARLCGNRFGRAFVIPGGTGFPVDADRAAEIAARLLVAESDTASAVELLWETPSVVERFQGTGTLSDDLVRDMGFVGVTARAAGLAQDVRHDFPVARDPLAEIPISVAQGGDVNARALVRWQEVRTSLAFLQRQLARLPDGHHAVPMPTLGPRRLVVSLVEGWRGEICHVALTDAHGRFAHYKIVDPSFHNWAGLAHALRDQQISDFPLCNKSFNLSYCGQDL
jgi:Ni,Fe-hydrogenase III large subunit